MDTWFLPADGAGIASAVLLAIIFYVLLVLYSRLFGRRTFAQLASYDLRLA